MVVVNFTDRETYKTAHGLWQYDYGQVLRIQGLPLPAAVEIHFALRETGGEAVTRIGTTKDGVTDVVIPDSMLENGDAAQNYRIYVFLYLTDADSGETIRRITLEVKSRPRPEAFETPEEGELFRAAIAAVNEAAGRAERAEISAEAWAHGQEEHPERAQDNAAYYAGQARDAAAGLPGQVEDAKREIDAYVRGKEEALKGDTGNVYFAAFRVVDGRLRMYSDPEIDKVRFVRIGSRMAYRLEF